MNLNNIRIATQLKLGSAARLFFVIALGIIAYLQSNKIQQQTDLLYAEPLQVGRAIGYLRSDIMAIRNDTKDMFLAPSGKEMAFDLNRIEVLKADAMGQLELLSRLNLGVRSSIDSVRQAFILWNSMREESIRMLREGNRDDASRRIQNTGIVSEQADILLAVLLKMDDFAKNNGDAVYAGSKNLNRSLNIQLILLIAFILAFSLLINYTLLRNIRIPISELTSASGRFDSGDMNIRSSYSSKNEFGVLSASFNTLVETIQLNTALSDKTANISGIMLGTGEAKEFFRTTLTALCAQTGSQVAAVYLLSENKRTYEHFESIGADETAQRSFSADFLEGEFGPALISRSIQRITDIPDNTRSLFHTVGGTFLPKEIITIPIYLVDEAIAVISLASVHAYSKQSILLINNIHVTLSARIEGILVYRKMNIYMEKLEQLNSELEIQKEALASTSHELREINTELEIQKTQVDEAGRLKSNFLSTMSHELRTPLNSVIALSGVLHHRLATKIPEEESGYLEVIERNGKRLLSLINDILDLSRIEAGYDAVELTTFNVHSTVADIVGMVQPLTKENNTELLHLDGDASVMMTSDNGKCAHILQNIIGNAAKFTQNGKVVVVVTQTEEEAVITVTDTGIGIAADHLPHIFDEFRQADGGTSRKFGGTGLGLAIANKYANMLGGTISVTSELGRGSEFTIALPLRPVAESRTFEAGSAHSSKRTPPRSPLTAPRSATEKTVLLVEDSEAACVQMREFLQETGCRIVIARDGREALDMIALSVPDAIILDLMLPGIDGYAVLKALRDVDRTAHIPVLVVTALYVSEEAQRTLKRRNIHQLIQKGNMNGNDVRNAVITMLFPKVIATGRMKRPPQVIEGKPVLLVVEDNADNMLTLKALLGDRYTVLEAIDCYTGVAMALKHKPHLIIMDIDLPGMDGIEAFAAIRKEPSVQHIPVISLTANAMASDRARILAHGFDAYIAKPVEAGNLFTIINEALYG